MSQSVLTSDIAPCNWDCERGVLHQMTVCQMLKSICRHLDNAIYITAFVAHFYANNVRNHDEYCMFSYINLVYEGYRRVVRYDKLCYVSMCVCLCTDVGIDPGFPSDPFLSSIRLKPVYPALNDYGTIRNWLLESPSCKRRQGVWTSTRFDTAASLSDQSLSTLLGDEMLKPCLVTRGGAWSCYPLGLVMDRTRLL